LLVDIPRKRLWPRLRDEIPVPLTNAIKLNARFRAILVTAAAVALLAVFYLLNQAKTAWVVTIETGEKGLTFHSLGEHLAWSLSELHGNPIEIAKAHETSGSAKNLELLLTGGNRDYTIAFVSEAVLKQQVNEEPSVVERVRVVATLYQDVLQVVVRTNIYSLDDLAGKRVFYGEEGSTTESIVTNILSALQIDCEGARTATEAEGAFYLAGNPADRVAAALADGSHKLLDLGAEIERIEEASGLERRTIPPFTYKGQTQDVRTLQNDVYLVSNASLPDELTYLVVETLFDDVAELEKAHHIRLDDALQTRRLPPGIQLHAGTEAFRAAEFETLYIATAGINDNYWAYGVSISKLLEQRGIQSRVIPTEGSVDNLSLLASDSQPVLAILQYDVALSAHTGDARSVYDMSEPPVDAMRVPGMRRIASLHEEKLHVLRRIDPAHSDMTGEALRATNWQQLVVCTGPRASGTRAVANTVLRLSNYQPLTTTELPVNLMVERIFDGSIDVGFFMGNIPNSSLKALLGSGIVRLLRVDGPVVARLSGQVFDPDYIDTTPYWPRGSVTVTGTASGVPPSEVAGVADSVRAQGLPVETIATRAALITTADLPFDVYKITRCVFEGADTLGLSTNEMAMDLAIPLHPDALTHYREMEYPGYTRPQTLVTSLGDRWWEMFHAIEIRLTRWGLKASTAETTARGLAVSVAVLLGILVNFVTKHFILAGLTKAWDHAESKWDAIFIERRVLNLLSYLVAAVVIYTLVAIAMARNEGSPLLERLVTSATLMYMLVIGVMIINCILNGALAIYKSFPISREIPLNGVAQLIKIAVYAMASIMVVAIIFDRSPVYLFSGLGALTAVGMLVFKDSILGFVSGLQLSANRMVATGDWIAMPKNGLDGEVLDVNLTMVKVQNFDKSIVTVPAHALTSEAFQNWRGMQESGGRRLKRSVHIDINTIAICAEPLLGRLAKIRRLADYIAEKRREIAEHNAARGIEVTNLVDGRRLTNIGLFRAYLVRYLKDHSKIRQDMTLLVRQLPPGDSGLPIEICAFITEKAWADFEAVQADVFDHILAIAPRFDLKVFQGPTGMDFRSLADVEPGSPQAIPTG